MDAQGRTLGSEGNHVREEKRRAGPSYENYLRSSPFAMSRSSGKRGLRPTALHIAEEKKATQE